MFPTLVVEGAQAREKVVANSAGTTLRLTDFFPAETINRFLKGWPRWIQQGTRVTAVSLFHLWCWEE